MSPAIVSGIAIGDAIVLEVFAKVISLNGKLSYRDITPLPTLFLMLATLAPLKFEKR